jgi:hypothetical protein
VTKKEVYIFLWQKEFPRNKKSSLSKNPNHPLVGASERRAALPNHAQTEGLHAHASELGRRVPPANRHGLVLVLASSK